MSDKKPGPDPEALKIEDVDWEHAMKRAIEKQRPEGGWPERVTQKRKTGPKKGRKRRV